MTLTVGSLFSGIGGMDLGLERAGHTVIWQSEINPYCNKVLKKHWPDVPNLGDITTIDWGKVERPDIICGGYPCQPFSTAGKRNGKNDPRHLWPAMHNAICQLRPRYALMENVRGHLSMGFGDVLADLAKIGYDAEWQVIPAAAVGALHKRDRVFIVAYPNGVRSHRTEVNAADSQQSAQPKFSKRSTKVAHTNGNRLEAQGTEQQTTGLGRGSQNVANPKSECSNGRQRRKRATQSTKKGLQQQIRTSGANVANTQSSTSGEPQSHGLCKVFGQAAEFRKQNSDGRTFSDWWETEPDVGRVAHGVPNRVDRLRGLGNAVVPQVAELVGRLIGEHAKQFQ